MSAIPKIRGLRKVAAEKLPEFNRTLGMTEIRAAGGAAEIDLTLGPELTNKRGVAHGGVIASLLDSVMGAAVVSAIAEEEWCGTVQLNIQFLAPGVGATLSGRGRMVKRGRHIAFARGEAVDARGEVIATGEGTWYVWPQRPGTGSGRPAEPKPPKG
jgi:uncharacterized protein (TIGR00369 family)